MIDRKDIENLATLSRIKIDEAEATSFQKEIESILGYVAQIQNISSEAQAQSADATAPVNILREDIQTTEGGEYTEALVGAAPFREGNFVKVKNVF